MSDICHICLEEYEYIPETLIKECCNAFICNCCWGRLLDSNDIHHCPICETVFQVVRIDIADPITRYRYILNDCKCFFYRFSILLKWILIGYITTNIVILLFFEDYWSSMDFLNHNLYFWPICTAYGYLIVCMYEYFSNHTCQQWYH